MNPLLRRAVVAFSAFAVILGLSACTTYALPDTALRGLAYTGGSFDSKAFQKCLQPGTNESIDNGGAAYYYPITVRTFNFSGGVGADAAPFQVSTKNNQELGMGGSITFTLDTSCEPWDEMFDPDGPTGPEQPRVKQHWPGGKLQAFHDTYGRSKGAFFSEDSTVTPQGWIDSMNFYLGGPTGRVMDTVGDDYSWQELYTDPLKFDAFVTKVKTDIPAQISALTGGTQFYVVSEIQLNKPTVSGELYSQMERAESDALARENAAADQAFIATFPGGAQAYQAWKDQRARAGLYEAQARCFNENRCTAVPVPAASGG